MMINRILQISVIFFIATNLYAEEDSQVLVALNEAKLKGSELYSYSSQNESKTLKQLNLPKKIYKASKKLQCRGYKYKYFEVNHSDGSAAFYGIAQPKTGGVVIGRHITIPKNENLMKETISTSTKSCLEIREASEHQNILFTTHFLSLTPNLFHIYQSINNDTTIYVGTKFANWKVNKGEVSVLK